MLFYIVYVNESLILNTNIIFIYLRNLLTIILLFEIYVFFALQRDSNHRLTKLDM